MKTQRLILSFFFLTLMISAGGQISITSDSLVTCKWDITSGKYIPTKIVKESMSIEIDKDLLALKISGKTQEMAYMEKAFLIDFREANANLDKWLFLGSDKNCTLYTVTIDIPKKMVSFITSGKEVGIDTPLIMFYYSISDIKINNDAINKHLLEKGDNKY
jgi:hypothetical protein